MTGEDHSGEPIGEEYLESESAIQNTLNWMQEAKNNGGIQPNTRALDIINLVRSTQSLLTYSSAFFGYSLEKPIELKDGTSKPLGQILPDAIEETRDQLRGKRRRQLITAIQDKIDLGSKSQKQTMQVVINAIRSKRKKLVIDKGGKFSLKARAR